MIEPLAWTTYDFLLDTDICSVHFRRPGRLAHRFIQYFGGLAISTVTLAELLSGAHKHSKTEELRSLISELCREVLVLPFDFRCAETFGQVRGTLLCQGISIPTADLMIASTALTHQLTLVTHNTTHFARIPDLRMEDWVRD